MQANSMPILKEQNYELAVKTSTQDDKMNLNSIVYGHVLMRENKANSDDIGFQGNFPNKSRVYCSHLACDLEVDPSGKQ